MRSGEGRKRGWKLQLCTSVPWAHAVLRAPVTWAPWGRDLSRKRLVPALMAWRCSIDSVIIPKASVFHSGTYNEDSIYILEFTFEYNVLQLRLL